MSIGERLAARLDHELNWRWRRLTARQRCLPDFLIVGAQKAGTSSLFSILSQHPDIRAPYKKEVHFFDGGLRRDEDTYALGLNWYRAHFDLRTEAMRGPVKTFEASPQYLYSPVVPQRIAHDLPNVKMIISLRNPVDRAVSHFYHEVRMGRESRPIEQALDPASGGHPGLDAAFIYKDDRHINQSYLARGLYAQQIRRYFDLFSPEQVLIVDSVSLTGNSATLPHILEFLELGRFDAFDRSRKNVNDLRQPVTDPLRQTLSEFYAAANQDLFDLLGRKFAW